MRNSITLILVLVQLIRKIECDNFDVLIDAKATSLHRIDSLNLLIYCESGLENNRRGKFSRKFPQISLLGSLLALTVLTIWIFKFRRVSWLNETGLAVIYGDYAFFLCNSADKKVARGKCQFGREQSETN